MKLTREKLKEIIKEELASLEEAVPSIHRPKPFSGGFGEYEDYKRRQGRKKETQAPKYSGERFVTQPGRSDYSVSIAKDSRARQISKEQEALLNDPVFRAGAGIPQDASPEEALRMHRGEIPRGKPYSLEEARLPAEERPGYAEEPDTFNMSADELTAMAQTALGTIDKEVTNLSSALARLVEQHEGGDFVALQTYVNMLREKLDDVQQRYTKNLGSYEKNRRRSIKEASADPWKERIVADFIKLYSHADRERVERLYDLGHNSVPLLKKALGYGER